MGNCFKKEQYAQPIQTAAIRTFNSQFTQTATIREPIILNNSKERSNKFVHDKEQTDSLISIITFIAKQRVEGDHLTTTGINMLNLSLADADIRTFPNVSLKFIGTDM